MESVDLPDDYEDPFQEIPEIKTIAVNQGFIPESVFFWRRWQKPAPV